MKKTFSLLFAGLLLAPAVPAAAEDKVDFAKQVAPILSETCYSCHGPEKQKGKLRLDTVEAFNKGGGEGPVVVAGDPAKSTLLTRVTLPPEHDEIMPPKGDPLKKEQTDLISRWIKEGASFGDWKGATGAAAAATEGPKKIELPEVAAADVGALDKVREAGALAMPLAQGVNLVDVSFQSAADKTNDAQLGLLTPVATQVYALNLAGSKVSDAGLAQLAPLSNLRRLHLEKTGVADAGLAHLKTLANLEYLNLYGTQVSDAGLAHLEGMKNLRSLYLWQSKVSDAGVEKLKKALPECRIDNGWKEPPAPAAVAAAVPAATPAAAPAPAPAPAPAADAAKAAEELKKAEEAKAEDAKKVADAKKADDEKKALAAAAAEAAKVAEAAKAAKAAEVAKATEALKAAEAQMAEAAKKADEAKKAAEAAAAAVEKK